MEEVTYQTNVLQKIGNPDERQYLLEVMAEQLGIPSSETSNPQALAVMANAVQRNIQYGWLPGVHMHVQSFIKKKGTKDEEEVWTLVDGEKAWKDNANRWRIVHNVQWRLQHKLMTKEELEQNILLSGYTEKDGPISRAKYGIWSRVIIIGQDDPDNADDPLYAAGLWFGKIKTGNFWSDDRIPTGSTSRDVAIRRADKKALMQSQLTLIPLDDHTPQERIEALTAELEKIKENKDRADAPLYRDDPEREVDGDVLFATK
jgi:hypothetical protein